MTSLQKARLLALFIPAALLAGAYGSQYLGGLYPCELCYWQRWAHFAAFAFAGLAYTTQNASDEGRIFVRLAALAIGASGAIAVYHAGVEAGIFEGFTQCTSRPVAGSSADILADIMAAPIVRCDEVQFRFLGISMAGWNAILSTTSALVILWLTFARNRPSATRTNA